MVANVFTTTNDGHLSLLRLFRQITWTQSDAQPAALSNEDTNSHLQRHTSDL